MATSELTRTWTIYPTWVSVILFSSVLCTAVNIAWLNFYVNVICHVPISLSEVLFLYATFFMLQIIPKYDSLLYSDCHQFAAAPPHACTKYRLL